MTQSTTEKLADFAASLTIEQIPNDVKSASRALFTDALACALAGHRGDETTQLHRLASSLGQSEENSVIGGNYLSLAGATMMNGYLITAVTMCDVHRATLTHITPEVVPPALAIAERDDLNGAALLAALTAGFEVTTRIGIGLDYPTFRKKGWHGPGVIGPFGAGAAVGNLRGFDADTMARTFGLAGSQSAGTFAAWGTPTVKFHQCRAALSGLMAALLAEQNFIATTEFLTAEDGGLYNTYANGGLPNKVTSKLGRDWELKRIALRMWPSATALQEVITALYNLVQKENVAFEEVSKVRLYLNQTPFKMHGGFSTYKTKFEALLSAHYVSAIFLKDRRVTLDQFESEIYQNPVLSKFAAERVEILPDGSLDAGQAIAEIDTKGGGKLRSSCDYPLGAPENPLSTEQLTEKLRICASDCLSDRKVDELTVAIDDLENIQSIRDLMSMIRSS